MSNEQDVLHEQQEERDVRDSNRDKRENHGRSKRLFAVAENEYHLCPLVLLVVEMKLKALEWR
jgi:hypothetical protein